VANDGSRPAKDGNEKVKQYAAAISAVSSLIAITVFLGWGDELKQAIPFAQQPPSSGPVPQPTWVPIPAPAEPPEVADTTDDETTTTETTTETTRTPSPEERRYDYIVHADAACAPAIRNRPARVATLDYGYMMAVLEARNRMLQDWAAVVVEPRDAANYGRIQQMWNDFRNASMFWNYMANNLLAMKTDAFYAELERYRASTAAFVNAANRYGFAVCNFGWNSVN
jgi:hypothetical protein